MINNTEFSHEKHKKYTLISVEDSHCWVQNLENGITNRCFPLPHDIGDEFYLFEKTINPYNGVITFEYSILNLYEEENLYTFEVMRETDTYFLVSSFPHLTFAAPISFRRNPEKAEEELYVEKFDLDKNKLFFGRTASDMQFSNEYIDNDLSDFEEGKLYNLPIKNTYLNKNGNRFLMVEYLGNPYHINVPERFAHLNFENTVECQLGYYTEGNRYSLKLTRYAIISRLYEKGKKYSFFVESQMIHPQQELIYWVLKDEYGYTNHYYPDSDLSKDDNFPPLKEGEYTELFVWKITEKGYLALSQRLSVIQPSKYIVEEVFEAIGYQGKENELFYHLEQEYPTIPSDDEENKISYLSQYQQGENLWFFTYFAFLDEQITHEIKDQNYDRARQFLDIYIKLERWLIYRSDYLKNFLPFKAAIIIEKAEFKIETLEAQLKIIDLLSNNQKMDFLEEIQSQMSNTRYLPKDKKNVLKELLKYTDIFENEITRKKLYACIALLIKNNILTENDRFFISKSIEINLTEYKESLAKEDRLLKQDVHYLQAVIPFQYLLVILAINDEDTMVHNTYNTVNLLIHLANYHQNPEFVRLAIHVLAKNGTMHAKFFLQEDVFDLNVQDFEAMVIYPQNLNSYYGSKGIVLKDNNLLTMIPQNHSMKNADLSSRTVCLLDDLHIQINSFYSEKNISDLQEKVEILEEIFSFLNFAKVKTEQFNSDIENSVLEGKVKTVDNSAYCFLTSKIDDQYIEPLLHVNAFNKHRFFEDIREYIKQTDHILYKIVKIVGNKVHINCSNSLQDYAEEILQTPISTHGIVIEHYENYAHIITEEGLPVLTTKENCPVGSVFSLDIKHYSEDETVFIANNITISDKPFEGNPVELYRNYLINAGVLISNAEENGTTLHEVYKHFDDNFRKTSILLLNCLDEYRKYIMNEQENIICLFVQTVLAGIMKNARSYQYYAQLETLYRDTSPWAQREEQLYGITLHAYQMLLCTKTKEEISIEYTEKYPKLAKLRQLVEAYVLCSAYSQPEKTNQLFSTIIHEELLALNMNKNVLFMKKIAEIPLLSANEHTQEENCTFNIGTETKTREFKSSLFYSASDESQEAVILRTICGFLNGNDNASLYIGVNDEGNVIGLERDLQHSPNIQKLDQYQNHLQSLIVGAFPREINHLLDFEFHKAGNLDYLEIKIPKYDKPVSYNNEFYQRQGVQTRILKGADLIDFMYRKVNGIQPQNLPEEQDTPSSQNTENTCLYIYEDNSYIVSQQTQKDFNFKVDLPAQTHHAYLLLCYDNGCINKVELNLITEKNQERKYKNIFNEHGNLVAVFIAQDDDEVILTTHKNGVSYAKIYSVQKISIHKLLTLKGNCLVQSEFDELIRVDVRKNLPTEYDIFRRDSKQGLGEEVSKDENLYLKIINRRY